MIFISAQPYDIYFAWQIDVQACNFRKFGVSDRMHVVIWYPENPEPSFMPHWQKLMVKYPEVKFSFYKDQGVDLGLYIPQLRPHILARYFDDHPELAKEVVFYHDSDIIFNFLPDFESLIKDDINWQSDTSSYLDYNYLRRKEDQGKIPENEAVQRLAEIGGVTVETFKSYAGKTGGAQCILKGIDGDFWRDVERQVIQIRKAFKHGEPDSINTKYFASESAGFQSWCADMWALNMALWSRNKVTDVTPLLDFSWATDSADTYLKKPIFHNAGANGSQPGVFHKAKYIHESPIGKPLVVKKDSASYYYVQAIKEAAKLT
jgi:hypothetical protein